MEEKESSVFRLALFHVKDFSLNYYCSILGLSSFRSDGVCLTITAEANSGYTITSAALLLSPILKPFHRLSYSSITSQEDEDSETCKKSVWSEQHDSVSESA